MSGFMKSLTDFGGDLSGTLTELGGKYLDLRVAKERAKYTTRPSETVQPVTAMPTPANPTKGVNSDGETMVAKSQTATGNTSIMNNKVVVYGGLGLLGLIGLSVAYKFVK